MSWNVAMPGRSAELAQNSARSHVLSRPLRLLALCAGVFVFALLVRAWTNTWLVDFWGDSYHHWLITRLTMQNGGVYSDYKGLEVVWTPLYHYLSMIPLWLSGRTDLVPLHWMNALFGALTCALVAALAFRLYQNHLAALTAGGILALMTWHIAFSGMNVAEVFSGFLLMVLVAAMLLGESSLAKQHVPLLVGLFLLGLAMILTRTDLGVYLGVVVLWLWIQKRYTAAFALMGGAIVALAGWSAWSWFKTGNPIYWYQQYAENNLHDWLQQAPARRTWQAFALYLNRLSPFVVPAILAGILGIVTAQGERRRGLWLVTALLAVHSLFLIVGFGRGIVPLMTERYLVIDLPLVALLAAGFVWLSANWWENWRLARGEMPGQASRAQDSKTPLFAWLVAALLLATTGLRFYNDLPELRIRRWGIDAEWQIGNFLSQHVKPGDIVLTDAPVAIYRSGKPIQQFVSSSVLKPYSSPAAALRVTGIDWVVTQTASYDAASRLIPSKLFKAQQSGTVEGIVYTLVWRYDPTKTDIQSEVWHVVYVK